MDGKVTLRGAREHEKFPPPGPDDPFKDLPFEGCLGPRDDDDDGDVEYLIWRGSDSNKPRPPTEKQALHKTALGSMAKILYNISFIINIQSFDMIKFKYSHHDLQYGKQALHKIALDRISHIHQNQNEPFLSSYVIMIYNIFH